MEEDSDLESNNSMCEEISRSREETDNLAPPKPSIPSRNRAPKRPDKPIYMPRAARERLSLQNSQGPTANKESSSPSSNSCISSSSNNHSCCHTTNTTESSSTFRQESPPTEADTIPNHTAEGSVHCLQEEKQKLETEPFVWDQTVSCFTDMSLEDYEKDKEYLDMLPSSAQTEDLTTDTADIGEEVRKSIVHSDGIIVFFFFLQTHTDI